MSSPEEARLVAEQGEQEKRERQRQEQEEQERLELKVLHCRLCKHGNPDYSHL